MNNEVLHETCRPQTQGIVRCKQELGGIIKSYYRDAASRRHDDRQYRVSKEEVHMRNRSRLWKMLPCVVLFTYSQAWAFKVMPSLNCYSEETADDPVARVMELKSDGAWFITQNSDFGDSEWQALFKLLGGRHVSEDNPDSSKSYDDYVRIMKTPPYDSMCYNETGGLPGGTLLSDGQIDTQFESHGNRPIICLTRSYGAKWREETDRCLKNPKVRGICMEYVKEALLDNINAPAECIRAILKQRKRVYILLHAADEGWTLEENRKIISNLNSWCPKEMQSPDVYLVYQNYSASPPGWFSPGGVKDAIDQACIMPNYTGERRKTGNT